MDVRTAENDVVFNNERDTFRGLLHSQGYCVIPQVLTPEQITEAKDLFWDWIEQNGKGIVRTNPKTWTRDSVPPHKRFGLFKEGGIAHTKFLWSLRLNDRVRRVFSDLWNDDDLLVSYDGATANLYKPEKAESEWPHWDQDFDKVGLHCVQALVALTDSPDSAHGGFSCWPRSHEIHAEYCAAGHAMCKIQNWHMLTAQDKKLLKSRGMHRVDVPYKAGDMVLWRSDLVHSGRAPSNDVHVPPRMVAYVCMTPRKFIFWNPESMLAKKMHAFYKGIQTSHWPHDQCPVPGDEGCSKYLANPAWFATDAQARLAGFDSLDQMQNRK